MTEQSIKLNRVPPLVATFHPPARGKSAMTVRLGDIEIARVRDWSSNYPTIEFHSGTDVAVAAEICEAIINRKHLP